MNRYVHGVVTILLFIVMAAIVIALWRQVIPIDWLASFGYKGIFTLSFINGVAPVAGPSQVATFFVARKLNPLAVGASAGVGGAIGEIVGYAFGYSLRGAQAERVEQKIQRIANWRLLRITRERSFIPLFVLASIPNPFFDPASALAGSLRIGFLKYFMPVLLGKVLRHVIIAYAGLYTLSFSISSLLSKLPWHALFSSFSFIIAVFIIAVVIWGLRSIFESEPDPFLLNLTFFAFAGQAILTAELVREGRQSVALIPLILPALFFLLLQIWIIRKQVDRTLEHYINLLKEKLLKKDVIDTCGEEWLERWANLMVRITGVDFYPEFYLDKVKVGSPREKARKQAVSILPSDVFDLSEDGITSRKLMLAPNDRRRLWRTYVIVCVASWLIFILCILIATGVFRGLSS